MNETKEPEILRSYVCISDDTNGGLMQVLGIVDSYDEAQLICMKHMFAIVEDLGDDEARVEHSMWKMMEQDTGVILHYSIISDQIVQPNGQNLIILTYDRDMKDIMKQLKKISEAKCQPIVTATQKEDPIKKFQDICNETLKSDIESYGGLIGPPSHPQNEYMEYNFKYLSTKLQGDTLIPILNMNVFKWGFPYMIMTDIKTWDNDKSICKDGVVVTYGIAAYLSKDDTTVIFISTYDELGDTMFGRAREIRVNVKDLCSRVKIKCVGMIEGGIL